jgi:hypothetical protein
MHLYIFHLSVATQRKKEKTTVKMAIPPVKTMHANPTDDQEIQTILAFICVRDYSECEMMSLNFGSNS